VREVREDEQLGKEGSVQLVTAVLGSHDGAGTSGQRQWAACNGILSFWCLRAPPWHFHAALLTCVAMVFLGWEQGQGGSCGSVLMAQLRVGD